MERAGHKAIFEEEWWYRAASDGDYESADYGEGQGLRARLVFQRSRHRGITILGMPPMARAMRPEISVPSGADEGAVLAGIRAVRGLMEALPPFGRFEYVLPAGSPLGFAFSLCGCSVTEDYTFRVGPRPNRDPWAALEAKTRQNVRMGSKRMCVEVHFDVERYIGLSRRFVAQRAFRDIIDYQALRRIWDACRSKEQSAILSCVDGGGRDLASAVLIWDRWNLYFWLSCRNADLNDRTASSVLMWSAMEFARERGLAFDADGAATPGSALFKSKFGLVPESRLRIVKTSPTVDLREAAWIWLVELAGPETRRRLLSVRNALFPRAEERKEPVHKAVTPAAVNLSARTCTEP